MAVTLRLAGAGVSGSNQTKLLAKGTLSIGRGPGNDWVLPDPERTLSKTHCILSIEGGRVVLTDVSTNGVHINGARQATARDSRTVLTDGDDFRLGSYTITVTEASEQRGRLAAPVDDPFDLPVGPTEGGSPLDVDPFEDPLGRAPNPSFQHHLAYRPSTPARADPFDVAEEKAHRTPDPDDDMFSGRKPTQEWQGPAQPDNADAPRHSFVPPAVLSPAVDPNAIDFDALIGDLGPSVPAARQAPPPPPPRAPAPPAPPQPPPRARERLPEPDDLLAPPVAQPPPPPQRRPAPVDDPFGEPDIAPSSPPPRAAPPPAAPPPVAPHAAPPSPPVASTPAGSDAHAVLHAFLEGAGIAGPAGADPAATMRLVGQVFRAMTEGLREVLLSRAAIKSDMRVEQTMIRARDNNALKFSVNVDDAVTALLQAQRPGYMAPLAATKEAFSDIKSHELAVMAGVQTALMSLLQRFDPATLEKRLTQGRLSAVLPGSRKARYWDSFTEVYAEIAREAEDDFQAVFGRAFAKAYTAQGKKDDS